MSYSEAIKLKSIWPLSTDSRSKGDLVGHLNWTICYYEAATALLLFDRSRNHFLFNVGPVTQTLGMCTELTHKALLIGNGATSAELKKIGHNTYKSYLEARTLFSEPHFIQLVFDNTSALATPDQVKARHPEMNETEVSRRWRVYFDHLRILDETYDKPFRTRYFTSGPGIWPEPLIIIIGIKILLNSMLERAGLKLLEGS